MCISAPRRPQAAPGGPRLPPLEASLAVSGSHRATLCPPVPPTTQLPLSPHPLSTSEALREGEGRRKRPISDRWRQTRHAPDAMPLRSRSRCRRNEMASRSSGECVPAEHATVMRASGRQAGPRSVCESRRRLTSPTQAACTMLCLSAYLKQLFQGLNSFSTETMQTKAGNHHRRRSC